MKTKTILTIATADVGARDPGRGHFRAGQVRLESAGRARVL